MIKYVVGFLIDQEFDQGQVALIRKTKPEWQKDKFNGIGGKIEDGESPLAAMIREFREETGVTVEGWEQFASITDEKTWHVVFFRSFDRNLIHKVKTVTEEEVILCDIDDLPDNVLDNLRWLLPMALSYDSGIPFYIVENKNE